MPPWLAQISSAQRKESKLNSSRWIQLATIGIDNTPRVRTLFLEDGVNPMKLKYTLIKEV